APVRSPPRSERTGQFRDLAESRGRGHPDRRRGWRTVQPRADDCGRIRDDLGWFRARDAVQRVRRPRANREWEGRDSREGTAPSTIVKGRIASKPLRPPSRFDARVKAADRKSTRLNSSHVSISYAVFCLK